jgi:membrane-bound metal-dependent hydrolase YbcI (DUF457 family)
MVFGGSQVLMDIEPLVHMIRGDAVLHGISHTVAGAFVVAIVSTLLGLPLTNAALRLLEVSDPPVSWKGASASAFIGTYSHIALDAVMHGDMRPLWPIANGNGFLGIVSVGTLNVLCIVAGLSGGAVLAYRALRDT